ncbi:MAG: glycosyltransferase family 39 protein [Pseudomonadota bacterium]
MSRPAPAPVRTLPVWVSVLLAVAAVAAMFWGSWEGSLYNSDDYMYVDHARTMVESGDWLELRFQGVVLHQRPPLAVWLLSASRGAFGPSVFAARLPQILAGLVSLLFTFLIGRELLRDERLGWISVGLMLATHVFYFHARGATTDVILLAGITGFLFCHLRFERGWAAVIGFGVAAAWMFMTKSVVAALPIGLAGLHWLIRGRWRLLLDRRVFVALGVALALVAPWHLVMTLRHGGDFWSEYIGFNVMARAGGSLFFASDPLYYGRQLLRCEGVIPWLYILGIAAAGGRLYRTRDPADRFLLLWLLCLFVPFQLSSTRLYNYFIPSVPALSLIAARLVAPVLGRPWVFPAVLVLLAGLFLDNNQDNLHPEYAGDQRRFAEVVEARVEDPETRVFSYNRFEMAFFHFTDRPIRMLTNQSGFHDTLVAIPMWGRTGTVELIPPGALSPRLLAGPFVCVTDALWVPDLCAALRGRCEAGEVSIVEGLRATFLVAPALPVGETP